MIIGISGKKYSGKSTVALMLQHVKPNTFIINFADALKEEVARALGKDVAFVEQNKERFRPLLQFWGTDYRRYYNEFYWTEKWFAKVKYIMDNRPLSNIIAADVRFLNEANLIREFGGTLIRVDRTMSASPDLHRSETDLDNFEFDVAIDNNGTLEELKNKVITLDI